MYTTHATTSFCPAASSADKPKKLTNQNIQNRTNNLYSSSSTNTNVKKLHKPGRIPKYLVGRNILEIQLLEKQRKYDKAHDSLSTAIIELDTQYEQLQSFQSKLQSLGWSDKQIKRIPKFELVEKNKFNAVDVCLQTEEFNQIERYVEENVQQKHFTVCCTQTTHHYIPKEQIHIENFMANGAARPKYNLLAQQFRLMEFLDRIQTNQIVLNNTIRKLHERILAIESMIEQTILSDNFIPSSKCCVEPHLQTPSSQPLSQSTSKKYLKTICPTDSRNGEIRYFQNYCLYFKSLLYRKRAQFKRVRQSYKMTKKHIQHTVDTHCSVRKQYRSLQTEWMVLNAKYCELQQLWHQHQSDCVEYKRTIEIYRRILQTRCELLELIKQKCARRQCCVVDLYSDFGSNSNALDKLQSEITSRSQRMCNLLVDNAWRETNGPSMKPKNIIRVLEDDHKRNLRIRKMQVSRIAQLEKKICALGAE